MHHFNGERRAELHGKVPIRNAVDGVQTDPVKAEGPGLHLPVCIVGGPCKGTAADGRDVQASSAVLQPSEIAQQHHRVGHELMAEGDGLGPLQMGVARHDRGLVFLRLIAYNRGEGFGQVRQRVDFIPQIHAEIQRHLIVAASRGVELFAHIPEALGQHLLDEHVDILGLHIDLQCAGAKIVQDRVQAVNERVGLILCDDPPGAQHRRVGHGAGDILPCHAAVKGDGRVEVVSKLRRRRLRPPCPKLGHNYKSFPYRLPL